MLNNKTLFLSLFFMSGCASLIDRDLSTFPAYEGVVGSRVVLKQEMLAVRLVNGRKDLLLHPYGGINNIIPRKDQLKPTPFRFDKVVVVAIVPAGTTFQVTRLVEENSFEDSSLGVFATVVASDNKTLVGEILRLNSLVLDSDLNSRPSFNPNLAEIKS